MEERYGLIGHPIATSGSPRLFAAAYGGTKPYDLIEGEDFETSWESFLHDYKAINVTAPFKEQAYARALSLAKEGKGTISGPCFKIKATNLLVRTSEGIQAHNSDFSGIILSVAEGYFTGVADECYRQFGDRGHVKVHQFMRENLEEQFGRRPQALVVGCGGAGKAAAVAAAEMGFATALMNRTPEKASALAAELPEYGFIPVPVSDFRGAVRECDLVIYTLPVPLDAIEELSVEDFAGETIPGERKVPKVILEANYKTPAFSGTAASRMAEGGCRYIPGRDWLLWQAVSGYGLMTGIRPDLAAMKSTAQW